MLIDVETMHCFGDQVKRTLENNIRELFFAKKEFSVTNASRCASLRRWGGFARSLEDDSRRLFLVTGNLGRFLCL